MRFRAKGRFTIRKDRMSNRTLHYYTILLSYFAWELADVRLRGCRSRIYSTMSIVFRSLLAVGLLASLPLCSQQASRAVDFQRQVRPILSENCFHCHGPDKNMRMGGLR